MAHDVFISYSSMDKTLADAVCAKLEGNQIRCWYAPRDVPPGKLYAEALIEAINTCRIFVLILSANANRSRHVMKEVERAVTKGVIIIPMRVEDLVLSSAMEYYLSDTHWLDAITPPVEEHLDKLTQIITNLLQRNQPSVEEQDGISTAQDQSLPVRQKSTAYHPKSDEPERLSAAPTHKLQGWVWGGIAGILGILLIVMLLSVSAKRQNGQGPLTLLADPTVTSTGTDVTSPSPETQFTNTPQKTAVPTETPLGKFSIGFSQVSPKDGMVLVAVPGAEFEMGGSTGNDDSTPIHQVTLDDFWIDQTEVTNAMYAKCVQAGKCDKPAGMYYGDPMYQGHPVVYVNWSDAAAYCAWAGRRLPTEAEWELAARGTDGRYTPWGEGIDCQKANYSGCGVGNSTEVGSYPAGASPYGALDMAGNVWEWVADWYGPYTSAPAIDPTGPVGGDHRVTRGGSWSDSDYSINGIIRNRIIPIKKNYNLGFRCALSN